MEILQSYTNRSILNKPRAKKDNKKTVGNNKATNTESLVAELLKCLITILWRYDLDKSL